MATAKDRERVTKIIAFAVDHGLTPALDKARRDAETIETVAKCDARADLLASQGYVALAEPFRQRSLWLQAT